MVHYILTQFYLDEDQKCVVNESGMEGKCIPGDMIEKETFPNSDCEYSGDCEDIDNSKKCESSAECPQRYFCDKFDNFCKEQTRGQNSECTETCECDALSLCHKDKMTNEPSRGRCIGYFSLEDGTFIGTKTTTNIFTHECNEIM